MVFVLCGGLFVVSLVVLWADTPARAGCPIAPPFGRGGLCLMNQ